MDNSKKTDFTCINENLFDSLCEILRRFFKKAYYKHKLKKFINEIYEMITVCVNDWEKSAIDSEAIKSKFDSYNVIEKIFDFWIEMENNESCSEEMIDSLAIKIAGEKNNEIFNDIKSLLLQINNKILNWLSSNADNVQKTLLSLAKKNDNFNNVFWKKEQNAGRTINNDWKTINYISKRLPQVISEKIHSENIELEPSLFGTLRTASNEVFPFLSAYPNLLPSVIFLTGEGGLGKTTHLKKFQLDIFGCSDKNHQNDFCYVPIFVSLTNMRKEETIKRYIIENYPLYNVILSEDNLLAVFAQRCNLICYIILLDGLNEYHGDVEDLFKEIKSMVDNSNVKFIITSRCPSNDINISVNSRPDITEITVNHISKEQACKFFEIDSFPEDYNAKTFDLLTTPFYMKICKELNFNFTFEYNINASILMYKYMYYNMSKYGDLGKTVIKGFFSYFCYTRYKKDSVGKVDNRTNGEVALTHFLIRDVKEAVEIYNNKFNTNIDCDDAIRILLECNLITRNNANDIVLYNFRHQNIRDIYAAYYVANVAWLILDNGDNLDRNFGCEIDMHADLRDFSNNVSDSLLTLFIEESKDIREKEKNYKRFAISDSCSVILHGKNNRLESLRKSDNLVILEVLFKISISEEDLKEYSKKFIEKYESCNNTKLVESLANIYILTLCQMAQYFRLRKFSEIDTLKSFEECLRCAEKARDVYDCNSECNSDGYNHIGKCLNSFLEYVLNEVDDASVIIDANYSLVRRAVSEVEFANSITEKCADSKDRIAQALLPILQNARNAYDNYNNDDRVNKNVLYLLVVHYVSRAYMTEACLRKSAESLNLMSMIFENDYNVKLHEMIFKKFNVNINEFKSFDGDRFGLCYNLYDEASKCSHIVRGYSAQKKAIMMIKYSYEPKDVSNKNDEIKRNLNISKRASRPLTNYWYGRYNNDILGNSKASEVYYRQELEWRMGDNTSLRDQSTDNTPLMLIEIEMLLFYPINRINDDEKRFIESIQCITFEFLNDKFINNLEWKCGLQEKIAYILKCLYVQKSAIETQKLAADKFLITRETVEENLDRFLNNLHFLSKKLEGKNNE